MKFANITVVMVCLWCEQVSAQVSYAQHRLFMTPAQRAALERVTAIVEEVDEVQDNQNDSDVKPVPKIQRPKVKQKKVTLNGLIVRPSDQSAVIWVNRKMTRPMTWRRVSGELTAVPGFGSELVLAPGQSLMVEVTPDVGND